MKNRSIDTHLLLLMTILMLATIAGQMVIHYRIQYALMRCTILYHHEREGMRKRDAWQTLCDQKEGKGTFKMVNRAADYLQWHKRDFCNKHKVGYTESGQKGTIKRTVTKSKKRVTIKRRRVKQKRTKRSLIGTQSTGFFRWPLKKKEFWLSSFFGPRKKPNKSWGFHYGVDMAALKGTVAYAAASGQVMYADYQKGYGNTVLISHNKQYTTRYAHLDTLWVRKGMSVAAGRAIGTVGDTGHTIKNGREASHLHFEISDRGKQVNPLPLLPQL